MGGFTFEQLRLPIAVALVALALLIFLPRLGGDPSASNASPTPAASVVTGRPGGAITITDTPEPTASPTTTPEPTPSPTATPTPAPTPAPAAPSGFAAEVLACNSISGSSCNGQFGTMPSGDPTLTGLMRFSNASAGDVVSVTLSGPGGTVSGGSYTLGGSGDGYYYSQFSIPGWPGGTYSLTAFRNGAQVASTTFARGG